MMKRIFWAWAALIMFASPAQAQLKDLLNDAKHSASFLSGKNGEISKGLKEALNLGVESAVQQLSVENGFLDSPYKILLPDEAQKVIEKVKTIPGFQGAEEKLIERMNMAAERATQIAAPIFLSAIRDMSILDAKQILSGPDDAATNYLSKTTRASLYKEFLPIIQDNLDYVNARTYWKTVVDAYNKIPFVKKVNSELDDHVNNKALDGIFALIAVKEKGIRSDVNQRTSELLKKVFGK